MLIPAHMGFSWLIANVGKSSRRLRAAVFLTGILPDLDGFGVFISQEAYIKYHHVLTHGLPFSAVASTLAVLFCKGYRMKALILTQIAFYVHYFGDYFFTQWRLYYFAPFSMKSYGYIRSVWLYHPVNYIFALLAVAIVIVIAVIRKRTPLEVLSRHADDRLVHVCFTRRTHRCDICHLPGCEICESCGTKLCIFHAWLANGGRNIQCKKCFKARRYAHTERDSRV